MSDWINHPLKLEGEHVLLLPLDETHFDDLVSSSREEIIWPYMPVKGTDEEILRDALREAVLLRDQKTHYPFTVIDKANNKIIGSTRYTDISEEHKKLEIGWTWYATNYWGKGYNEECKLLLLTHCFEALKTVRVQIKTWDKNSRSRKAVERIGAKFEGILRNNVIRHDGCRHSAYYSIIDTEWQEVKPMLTELCKEKYHRNQSVNPYNIHDHDTINT